MYDVRCPANNTEINYTLTINYTAIFFIALDLTYFVTYPKFTDCKHNYLLQGLNHGLENILIWA